MTHTQSPWTAKDNEIVGAHGELLATINICNGWSVADNKANGRLMAAAPAMLDMLKTVKHDHQADGTTFTMQYSRICAAIAQAEK